METIHVPPLLANRFRIDPLKCRALAREEVQRSQRAIRLAEAEGQKLLDSQKLVDLAGEATKDPYVWATTYTETYNPHWVEEGRKAPYEKFPPESEYPHLAFLFDSLELERIHWIEKSRDMMISWGCVAYLTVKAMVVPAREVLFQTQKKEKVIQLVDYAKCLYRRQPQWLQDAFPLSKKIESQPSNALVFAHGGRIVGIPGGADQIRSYHPWGYLNDESSFQPDAGECYNEALSAVSGKIIFNSSAGPGWYADARHDVVLNVEE